MVRLSVPCLSNSLASWVHMWSEWQPGKKKTTKKQKHLRWASSKGNTAAWLMRALKYWCLVLFMALIREKWEKMGHSGSCSPNSFSECMFVSPWIWAEHCRQCAWNMHGGAGLCWLERKKVKVVCFGGMGNHPDISWHKSSHLNPHQPPGPLSTPSPTHPTPDWDPAPSVCLWYVVYVAGRSSWAEPAIKQPPTTTVTLSALIGAEAARSHQSTVCLQRSMSRDTVWIKKYNNVVLT